MRSAEFLDAVDGLLTDVAAASTVVVCSESLWWRCHRRLIADFVTLARATPVRHLACADSRSRPAAGHWTPDFLCAVHSLRV